MKKSIAPIPLIVLSLIFCLLVTGCSGKSGSSIVGQWAKDSNNNAVLIFAENGDFNSNFGIDLGLDDEAVSYSISSDGMLEFRDAYGYNSFLNKSSSKDCKLSDYYLNGNTLIIDGETFTRVQ